MATIRKFLRSMLLSLALAMLPRCNSLSDKVVISDEDVIIDASNKLMDNNIAKELEKKFKKDCYTSGNKITCQVEYGTNKSQTDFINESFPQLKDVIEKDNKKYSSAISIGDKEVGIKIYSQQKRGMVFYLSKKPFSPAEKESILKLESILDGLFNVNPRNIFEDGKKRGINCMFYGKNSVKCLFQYETLVANKSVVEVGTPEKYRSLEAKVNKGPNHITLKAENY